ncbi:MAG: response regulator [Spirochaetia bacterium]|nr:response regulator [Spirochaetia bacterium]
MQILIVDDEMMIKEWLCYTIQSLPYEVSLLDVVSNGEEALKKIEKHNYDLMFIDILMPRMTGLELLIELNKQHTNATLIVLSSHDEFNFARQALKYNVKEYLLKNECSKEKLSEILQECQDRIVSDSMNSELIKTALSEEVSERQVSQLKRQFPDAASKPTVLVVFDAETTIEALSQKYTLSCDLCKEGLVGKTESNTFMLFSLEGVTHTTNVSLVTQEFSKMLYQRLGKQVAVSRLCSDHKAILREVRGIWIAYQSLFYSDQHYCFGAYKYQQYDEARVGSLSDRVISAIRCYSKEQTTIALDELTNYFKEARPTDIDFVKHTYASLLSTFVIYNNKQSQSISEKLEVILSTIYSFDSFASLVVWAKTTIENDAMLIRRSSFSSPVKEALLFIEHNFASIRYVKDIADHVNLSLDYFSRVFKKEVGLPISSYLMHYRLDKASVMLKSSDLSIKEIAQKVGIENVSYFSRSFKKKFQVQPIVFRVQSKEGEGR